MKYFKKDEEFLNQRRLFIRNVGLTLAAFGFAPNVRFDLTQKLLVKAGLNSLYAFEIGNAPAEIAIEVAFRTSANLRKYMMPRAASNSARPANAHVWAGSLEAGAPTAGAVPIQSPTTGNWFAQGPMFNLAKDIPMATFMWQRNQANGNHQPNFSVRNGLINSAQEEANGLPCPTILHAAATPRRAILNGVVVWNLNGANVVNNVAGAKLQGAGYQVPVMQLVNNGNSTDNTAGAFINIFSAGFRLDGFNQQQKIAVAQAINDFSSDALNRAAVANAPQVLGSTQSVAQLISTNVGEQLALTPAEVQAWAATNVSWSEATFNWGLAMASIYKAARLGLAQDFILQIQEGDQHSESEASLQNNSGWQILHQQQALQFAQMMNTLYNVSKNDPSPFGSGKSMWDSLAIHISADYHRSNLAVGATDSGDGSSIVLGGGVNPGTFYDHSNDFQSTGYASDPTTGGQIQFSNMFLPTPPQAWRMVSRLFCGNSITQKFHNPNQLGPGGLLYSYILKQTG